MDHSPQNPMWGSSSGLADDENTLQNMILQMPATSNWSSPPIPPENLSNDVPPSPFSEFFLSRNFVQSVDPLPIFDNVEQDDDGVGTNLENNSSMCNPQSGGSTTKSLSFSTPERLHFTSSTPSSKASPPKISESGATYYVSQANNASPRSSSYFPSKKAINVSSRKTTNRNSEALFSCDNCSFTAADRHTFMVHKRSRHYGEKSFSCNDCSAKFTRSYSLKKHVLQKHQGFAPSPQLPKYCPFPSCNFVTRNSNTMQIHKRSHQNASVYYCKQCNTRYVRRQSLLHHLTHKHSSNAALIGMKKIGVSLTNPVTLDDDGTHENRLKIESTVQKTVENNKILVETRSKEVEKLYNCDKCQFTSKNFLDVYRHKQSAQHVVDDEKTLINKNICLYCHKKFASSNNLLTHIKKQHLESMKKNISETKKMFFCTKCSFSTTRKKVLKAHEDNSHVVMEQEQQQQPNICFNLAATPKRRSPPKSDRNSVQSFSHSDGTFVSYGNNKTTTNQNLNLPIDLPNDNNCFNTAACSSYCSFSTSSSSINDPLLITGNGSASNTVINGSNNVPMMTTMASRNVSTSSNSDSFDEMASCVQHIQMANSHLLQLCRRRENELKTLRANVIELLKRIYPNNYQFFSQNGCFPLENVDQLVINAINDNL